MGIAVRYATKAWAGLAAYLAVVEVFAPEGETLSEGVDTWMEKHPGKAIWYGLVGIVGAHLLNLIPPRYDPIHRLFASTQSRMTWDTSG